MPLFGSFLASSTSRIARAPKLIHQPRVILIGFTVIAYQDSGATAPFRQSNRAFQTKRRAFRAE
jgi:hypothetical protein